MNYTALRVLLLGLCLGVASTFASGAIEPPVAVRMVPPKFPPQLAREGISGIVAVRCTIDEKGNVTEPTVEKSSNPAFDGPALEAIVKWRFKPATKDGAPVPLKVTIPIRFNASDE